MASADAAPTLDAAPAGLLELPIPCLLAMLQCLEDDPVSLFSAARAHSTLHQVAVLALRSITISIRDQQHADNVLRYLTSIPGQHICSISLGGPKPGHDEWDFHVEPAITLQQLPCALSSLELNRMGLQLQPHKPRKGADSAAVRPRLKQLRLCDCRLYGGAKGLAAALSKLPGLEYLKIDALRTCARSFLLDFPTNALTQLQQLTYLELACIYVQSPDQASAPLQPLQALAQLADFRVVGGWNDNHHLVLAGMLSGSRGLTRLRCARACIEPDILAGRAQLQHLQLLHCVLHPEGLGPARVGRLLGHLQEVTQLTHLDLQGTLMSTQPPAAFSALTASSKLQHLDISRCTLPGGVWQHLFPAGRQLQHLQHLDVAGILESSGVRAAAPDSTRLVSCCPALQSLHMMGLQCSAEVLQALPGLSGLRTLLLSTQCDGELLGDPPVTDGRHSAICQLTGLRELELEAPNAPEGLLLQLAQLKQLTRLTYVGMVDGKHWLRIFLSSDITGCASTSDDSSWPPVWRQILQLYLEQDNDELSQQAAATLAEVGLAAQNFDTD